MRKKQNSEKFDSETSKLQPVNLSERSGHTARVHQSAADSLQSLQPFATTRPCNNRLIMDCSIQDIKTFMQTRKYLF